MQAESMKNYCLHPITNDNCYPPATYIYVCVCVYVYIYIYIYVVHRLNSALELMKAMD